MAVDPRASLSPLDYLALERRAKWKSEYVDGEMVAMAGISRNHALIVTNLSRELSTQLLQRPCEVYSSDMRVRVPATGLYTYPDIVAICAEPRFEDEHSDTLLNPTVIVEVLSPSTEACDRGKKFENYRTLQSLREYLLAAQDGPRIDHYARQGDGQWLLTPAEGLDAVVVLPSIQCELALAGVYSKVSFG